MLSDVETQGGAAIAASRLAEALIRKGHQVTRIVAFPEQKPYPWNTEILSVHRKLAWRVFRRLSPELWQSEMEISLQDQLAELLRKLKPDVINVHNLHSAYPLGWRDDLVQICRDFAPTFWTLHDMWSFTGRCAYSHDCDKFITGCDETCPTPTEYPVLDPLKIKAAWQKRRRLFQLCKDLVAISPSQWLADQALKGFWREPQVKVISYGIPLNVFRPLDKLQARRSLGIHSDHPVILAIAANLSEPRKGTGILLSALETRTTDATLITIGKNPPVVKNSRIECISLGYIEDQERLVQAYNAATVLVQSSLADNQSNVILESISCGTPVVAFDTGGTPEVIKTGVTGWIASQKTPEALAAAIETSLAEADAFRERCREVAEHEYCDAIQAQRYLELFQQS